MESKFESRDCILRSAAMFSIADVTRKRRGIETQACPEDRSSTSLYVNTKFHETCTEGFFF